MVSHELLEDEGILVVEPKSALESADFESIAKAVDPYIERQSDLRGVAVCKSDPNGPPLAPF